MIRLTIVIVFQILVSNCKNVSRINSALLTPAVSTYTSRACLSCLKQRCFSSIRLYSSANQAGTNVSVWKVNCQYVSTTITNFECYSFAANEKQIVNVVLQLRRRKIGIFVGCIGVLFLVGAYVNSAIYHGKTTVFLYSLHIVEYCNQQLLTVLVVVCLQRLQKRRRNHGSRVLCAKNGRLQTTRESFVRAKTLPDHGQWSTVASHTAPMSALMSWRR